MISAMLKPCTMFQHRRTGTPALRITRPSAIAALASPVRQELFDTFEALGGVATIAELAEQLGRPADGLYYHVEVLRRAGVIAAAPLGRSRAGRAERRYRIPGGRPGRQVGLLYQPRDPRNASAVRSVVGGMLRIARRDFDRAFTGDVTVDGPHRELWAARGTGWVTPAELAAINRLLIQLATLLRRPRRPARQRLISLCFVLAPMTPRPARRAAPRAAPAPRRSRSPVRTRRPVPSSPQRRPRSQP